MDNVTELRKAVAELVNQSEEILRPKTWHAYLITIEAIEFWHGGTDRFHKRLRYDLKDGVWQHQRLQP